MKEATIKRDGESLCVYLKCEIDHHTAKTIREEVDKELLLGESKRLILDFSGVTFMDSSGIGLIIGRADKAERIGAALVVRGLSPTLRRLVHMSGIERLGCVSIM